MKTLEELGIGRPSTYASIIQTIQARNYVRLEQKRFMPEDVAEVVTDQLIQHFPDIVDVHFTAGWKRSSTTSPRASHAAEGAPGLLRPFSEARSSPKRSGNAIWRSPKSCARSAPPRDVSPGGCRSGWQVRQVHRLQELPRLRLHQEHRRERAPGAGAARRELPGVRTAAGEAGRPLRAVRGLHRAIRTAATSRRNRPRAPA